MRPSPCVDGFLSRIAEQSEIGMAGAGRLCGAASMMRALHTHNKQQLVTAVRGPSRCYTTLCSWPAS